MEPILLIALMSEIMLTRVWWLGAATFRLKSTRPQWVRHAIIGVNIYGDFD